MISMLPPWPTIAISVPLPACFAASTAPIALSSLMPTTSTFFLDRDLKALAAAAWEVALSPPPSRWTIAFFGHGPEPLLNALQGAHQPALDGSARTRRLQKQKCVHVRIPVPGRVLRQRHAGRKARAVIVDAKINRSVMRIHQGDERNLRARQDVRYDRRDMLE